MYRVILANSLVEANAYAREQGWAVGTFRSAAKAGSVRGLREAEIHYLPSFARRLDRHAFESTLRFTKGPRFSIDEGWEWPAPKPEAEQPELPFDTSTTVSGPDPVTTEPEPEPVVVEKARVSTRPAKGGPKRDRQAAMTRLTPARMLEDF